MDFGCFLDLLKRCVFEADSPDPSAACVEPADWLRCVPWAEVEGSHEGTATTVELEILQP